MFDMKQFANQYATIDDLQQWAQGQMVREPDFVIGEDYMRRWYIIPRNENLNLYLHEMRRSDNDVMHDHPWDNTSLVIRNGYMEHTPLGSYYRAPGQVIPRKASDAHRLELLGDQSSVSLFMTGPKIREWGFHCPNGWIPWQMFTNNNHSGRSEVGAGCGEP